MKKLICLLAVLFIGSLSAQTKGTGAYPFSSLDNKGFDAINLGNLNTRFTIPIVNRTGRGIGFSYSIQNEGLIWQPVVSGSTTSWSPNTTWGFAGLLNGTTFSGYLSNSILNLACPRPPNYSGQVPPAQEFTNYVYHDAYGSSHRFNYTYKGPCPLTGQGSVTTGDGSTSDGSGYSLVLSNTGEVRSRNGTIITPATSPTGQNNTSITDTNGNTISASGGNSFKDTLGVTALTVSGSGPVTFDFLQAVHGTYELPVLRDRRIRKHLCELG
jgi:hypothetical protein